MAITRFESDKDAAIKLHFSVGQKKSTGSGCGDCASVSNVLLSEEGEGRSEQATAVEDHGPLRLAFPLTSRRLFLVVTLVLGIKPKALHVPDRPSSSDLY